MMAVCAALSLPFAAIAWTGNLALVLAGMFFEMFVASGFIVLSVAYATQEILLVLTLGGLAYLYLAPWIGVAVVALLAVVKAGGAYLPIDPGYPVGRVVYMLDDAAPVVVLASVATAGAVSSSGVPVVVIDDEGTAGAVDGLDGGVLGRDIRPEHPAYVIYTSGSTGVPKGVVVRHRSLVNYTHYICGRLGIGEGGREEGMRFATVSTITAAVACGSHSSPSVTRWTPRPVSPLR